MNTAIDPQKINPNLPGIILLSHGPLAGALVRSMELIAGPADNIIALELNEGDPTEEFLAHFQQVSQGFSAGVLVLVDLYGGTPFNQLALHIRRSGSDLMALSGVNLCMLLDAIAFRQSMWGDELLQTLEDNSKTGIVNITKMLRDAVTQNE